MAKQSQHLKHQNVKILSNHFLCFYFIFFKVKNLQKLRDLQQNSWRQESFTLRVTANMKFPPKHWGFTASAHTEPTHTSLQAPVCDSGPRSLGAVAQENAYVSRTTQFCFSGLEATNYSSKNHTNMSVAKVLKWFLAPQKLLLAWQASAFCPWHFLQDSLTHLGNQTRARWTRDELAFELKENKTNQPWEPTEQPSYEWHLSFQNIGRDAAHH